jgi:hypothetical protein
VSRLQRLSAGMLASDWLMAVRLLIVDWLTVFQQVLLPFCRLGLKNAKSEEFLKINSVV